MMLMDPKNSIVTLFQTFESQLAIQSNLVSTTLVYTTPLILRHIFVQPDSLVQNSFYTQFNYDS